MKYRLNQLKWNQLNLLQVYVLSFAVSMIYLMFRKSELLIQTSWMDSASLESLKNQLGGGRQLFFFVLRERAALIIGLFVLATTYLGNLVAHLNVIWFGTCSGMFLTIVILRYGLRGILLLIAGMFPHYLIYIPAMVLTLSLVREKRVVNRKYCLQLLVILLVVITGCVLECYVNPYVLAKMLKNFRL